MNLDGASRRPGGVQLTLPGIAGLRYVRDYLDSAAHDRLLTAADEQAWQLAGTRRVQIYGYSYNPVNGIYRLGELPPWVGDLADRLWRERLMPSRPDQMIVNDYPPGTGIFSHVDLAAFEDTIVSISLMSTCVMEFTHVDDAARVESLLLEPRSALVLSGDTRGTWKHAIPHRHIDRWMERDWVRGRRVSLTFRAMRREALDR